MSGVVEPEAIFLGELGRRVRDARTVRGLSRKLLSQTSGLSERYIAQLESGQGNVSIILLRRVANAMGVRLDDMIAGQDSSPDWRLIRDLLREASPEQVALAKSVLSGTSPQQTGQGGGVRVALVGLRGAGKSTLGRLAAERLGWTFVELNAEIERENALSVQEIYAIYGQEGYRRLEQRALRRLTAHPGPLILATGGSIVAEPLTYDLLLQSFVTIWLQARPEEHMQRVRDQGHLESTGDHATALEDLRSVLLSREPLYARATATVDTSGVPVATMLDRLIAMIDERVPMIEPAPEPHRRSA
ncbi:helix-turn-helix transcriptional regulator [Methylobacterium haplocladii]|uniref:Shikimate kinase n=1 Tax=Methylobacterium haplocladii TaxID=1176176 RepID=A0A512IUN1_9HYPH|nr:helix-turn-helix transcriptional regulator [Methylobacterium haplocladii]GEP01339.1 shikimate kinase [Methylobacterium haplocladii]GJD83883.1 Shikimate kinase [Methylobacterium haplocladii]GLS59958.1 shikimate kinase [Methylobacterium haplocladii]